MCKNILGITVFHFFVVFRNMKLLLPTKAPVVKTISEAIGLATKFLHDRGVERARRLSEEVFAHILKLKRLDLYLQFDRPLLEGELDRAREWLLEAEGNTNSAAEQSLTTIELLELLKNQLPTDAPAGRAGRGGARAGARGGATLPTTAP